MRQRFLFPVLAAVLLLLAACSGGGGAGFTADDLALSVGGAQYRCGIDIETVIADLGEGYSYSEGMSCDYDGMDKTFLYGEAEFQTNPLAAGDTVCGIFSESAEVATSKGLTVGAGRDEVLAAYGEASEDHGDLLIYRVEGERASLSFELDGDGRVWALYLTTQPV